MGVQARDPRAGTDAELRLTHHVLDAPLAAVSVAALTDADFAKWAGEAAKDGGVWFVDLNRTIADRYDAMGPEKVRAYFPFDSTHTNAAGAQLNAQYVIDGMKAVKCPLGFWARVWRKK